MAKWRESPNVLVRRIKYYLVTCSIYSDIMTCLLDAHVMLPYAKLSPLKCGTVVIKHFQELDHLQLFLSIETPLEMERYQQSSIIVVFLSSREEY